MVSAITSRTPRALQLTVRFETVIDCLVTLQLMILVVELPGETMVSELLHYVLGTAYVALYTQCPAPI